MNRATFGILFLTFLLRFGVGCQSGGNRRTGSPTFTRVSEIRGMVGKRVTLVGTARAIRPGEASIELRDGLVDLPAYQWPEKQEDRAVSVMGTLVKPLEDSDNYRLGEIEMSHQWSR